MSKFIVDNGKCIGCGNCEGQCGFLSNVKVKNGKAAYEEDLSSCIECFHCLKVCPKGAIHYNNDAEVISFDSDKLVSSVLKRRSSREYLEKSVEKDLLAKIINEANTAPRFDIEFCERKFFVVNSKEKLKEVRELVLKEMSKGRKFFKMLSKLYFIPGKKRKEYIMIADLLGKILGNNLKEDSLFHGAPALVIIAGPKSKTVSPDNSFYAMGQLMTLAEEKGLSTCINGFVSLFWKAVGKNIGLDNGYKIFNAAVIGYPKSNFNRSIVRTDSSIEWR